MTITVRIQDSIVPLIEEWESLAQRTKAIPFLWPGWIAAWWSAFGAGRLQILTAYQDGRLAGVLPLYRFRGTLSSTTNPHTPSFDFLAANETAVEQLSHALFSQRAHRIDLSFLIPTDPGVSPVHLAADTARYRVLTESIQAAPYVAINGISWDAYESGLGKNLRKDIRRRRRRLEEEGRLTLEVSDGKERLDEHLEEGFRVEGSGWKGSYGTSINARPATRRFYTEIALWAAERGWLRLAFLRLDGQALAFDYCLEYNRIHYALKTGYDPAYERFSPGKVLRHLMIARAFSEELAIYDFLGIADAYKKPWTNAQQERLFLRMFAPTARGFLDRTAFVSGRLALEGAKSLAGSPVFGERGRRILRRGYSAVRARFGR
jgi:CelD/BcsL family acetyltransferase involved in cellulose biosynthesis